MVAPTSVPKIISLYSPLPNSARLVSVLVSVDFRPLIGSAAFPLADGFAGVKPPGEG